MPDSPQAILPVFTTLDQNIRSLIRAQNLDVRPPNLLTASGAETAFPDSDAIAFRVLQNCGTNAVYVCIGDTASANNFHYILAACSAQDDGLGSVMDCSKYKGAVSIYSSAAHRVATFAAYGPSKVA